VRELLNALSPAHWRSVAELQLRLGLRASEVLALGADWIDEAGASIHVLVSEGFDTKSHASRIVDGVDAATLALAREVLATKDAVRITLNGYVQAWKRACHQLETAGTPWRYRNKSHALRSLYATQSRLAGVPLNVVRDRMGHESERTTERHYVGRTIEAVPGPFADVPLMSQQPTAATVIPFRRCAS
jgi:integrase